MIFSIFFLKKKGLIFKESNYKVSKNLQNIVEEHF